MDWGHWLCWRWLGAGKEALNFISSLERNVCNRMAESDSHGEKTSAATSLAQLVVAAGSVIYATGFLVVLTHLDTLGITESGADFFKLRYLHVGILCLAPIVIALGVYYAIFLLWRSRGMKQEVSTPEEGAVGKEGRAVGQFPSLPGILVLVVLLIVFFIVITLTPAGFLRERFPLFLSIFVLTTLGLAVSNKLVPKWLTAAAGVVFHSCAWVYRAVTHDRNARIPESALTSVRGWVASVVVPLFKWFLVCADVFLAWLCLRDVREVKVMLYPSAWFYALSVTCFLFFFCRVHFLQDQHKGSAGLRRGLWALAACILGPLYFIIVTAFAYSVFTAIPASRGGACLSDSSPVVLFWDSRVTAGVPAALLAERKDGIAASIPLAAVEEGSEVMFVVPLEDYRNWIGERNKMWPKSPRPPKVFTVNRNLLLAIEHDNTKRVE